MHSKKKSQKLILLTVIIALGAITAFVTYPAVQRRFRVDRELSEGLEHLRILESVSRRRSDKSTTNGIGVITTAWTNVFNDRSTLDLPKLERLVDEIKSQGEDLASLDYETLDLWLDGIVSIQPKSKSYIEELAKKNLSLSFSRPLVP